MALVLDCPACHLPLSLAPELIGAIVACPHCHEHFILPREGATPERIHRKPTEEALASPQSTRFTFVCGRCDSPLEARSDLCGQPGRCPTCGALFLVPNLKLGTNRAVGPAIVADDGQLPTPMHAYATAGDRAPVIRRLRTGEQVIICPRCRQEMPIDANTCSACGVPFTMEGVAGGAFLEPESNRLASAALIVGILAIIAPCQPVLGPIAIGLGVAGLKEALRIGPARPGFNHSIAGLALGTLSAGIYVVWQLL